MAKQPYIPIYIGDWLKDTGDLSLEAEGALLKLVFKLWDAPERGLLSISFSKVALLLKKDEKKALEIVRELQENDTLNIEFLPDNKIKFESRRMLKAAAKSKAYSENGKKGGRPEKAKRKPIESQLKAKVKPITDNDIDNDNEDEIEIKGVRGEFPVILPFTSHAFKTIWGAWKAYRVEMKRPYHTFSGEQSALDRLSKHPEEVAIGMLKLAMSNEWKDFYKPEENGNSKNGRQSAHDKKSSLRSLADELRKSDSDNHGHIGSTGG